MSLKRIISMLNDTIEQLDSIRTAAEIVLDSQPDWNKDPFVIGKKEVCAEFLPKLRRIRIELENSEEEDDAEHSGV